ncbi:hypothetical protein [Endozoicomonas sp. GU-1]|uniref:hypothetical protein n=1 Tax=Endozoicomonas sp. GU-1 TaxID=3009078 RepID=UPI0022B3F611|nr:hypothetical protein [Endozoicomonas sp. GU-1]WBA83775.1 hypothetical protein O2T12_11975 [Endozoicomonas sp. GU-1]
MGSAIPSEGLSDCFVDTLQGSIRNLHFTDANINSQKTTGLAACVVDDTGTVSNIRAVNVHIVNSGMYADAGIGGGGRVKGMVANIMAVNSHVTTSGFRADAGIGGGGGEVKAGGTVANTRAVNSHVKTTGPRAETGIGGGGIVERGGTVANTTAVNSTVKAVGFHAYVGIGGGGGLTLEERLPTPQR